MTFLIQQTMIYAVPLMIVALAGVFAERSGIINLALEGIMILGAFIGVLFVNIMQTNHVYDAAKAAGDWAALQGFELLAMLVAAIFGAIFSLLLSFASVNLRADQTIGGTALNLMAPALVLFLIRIIANQNTLQMATGDAASWFMIKKTTLGYAKTDDLGFLGNTFLHKVYLATYVCIIIFVVLSILLYKTRFGLRLRSCGENPQAADSVGINVYKMRWAGVLISGFLGGIGGIVFITAGVSEWRFEYGVAGFGFLSLAVMIFGQWKPQRIALAALLFGPGAGFAVGAVADMIGGTLSGYAINPLITLGAGSIGLTAGLLWRALPNLRLGLRTQISVFAGHAVGSIVINSLALHLFYNYPWSVLVTRIPNALVLAAVNTVLVRLLLENMNLVVTRETILQVVWGTDISVESRTVDMHIRTLRKKLGDAGRYICTVRKVGYKLADSEEGEEE